MVHRYRHRALLVAVPTDSAYVHDGLQSKALQWKASGWITTRGPVININLWDEMLETLLHGTCTFNWVKVPSHVDIAENEKADQLAEQGRKMSPLYNTVRRAVRPPCHSPLLPPSIEDTYRCIHRPTHSCGTHPSASPR